MVNRYILHNSYSSILLKVQIRIILQFWISERVFINLRYDPHNILKILIFSQYLMKAYQKIFYQKYYCHIILKIFELEIFKTNIFKIFGKYYV